MKKLFEYFLVFGLLSPLLFINIRDSHDWGDDFAGYIRQAKNIAEGKPFYESTFQFHDYNTRYSPPYYSYGFPLLLAPVVKTYGIDFKSMDCYMSLWLIAWALLVFGYLRKYFSLFTSLSFILIFFLNPYFFDFKISIISDIPFSFFFLLTMILYEQRKGKPIYFQILTGFILAFLIGIRGIGMILLILMLAELGINWLRYLLKQISTEDIKRESRQTAVIISSSVIVILIADHILFKAPAGLTGHFIGLFHYHGYKDVVLKNLDLYTNQFMDLFYHDTGKYSFSINYTRAFMLTFLVIGFFNSLFAKEKFQLSVFIIFGITILLFPFSTQGFRYLLPILPIFIYYIITGAQSIRFAPAYSRTLLGIVFVVVILLQYKKDIHTMQDNQQYPVWPGPYTEGNQKAIEYIRSSVPDNAVIASLKPRAIGLLTDRKTCVLPSGSDIPTINRQLSVANPTYLLSIKDLGNVVDSLAAYRKDSLIWQNNSCSLYLCTNNQNHP